MNMRHKSLIAFVIFGMLSQACATTSAPHAGFFARAWNAVQGAPFQAVRGLWNRGCSLVTPKIALGATAAVIAGFVGWRLWLRAKNKERFKQMIETVLTSGTPLTAEQQRALDALIQNGVDINTPLTGISIENKACQLTALHLAVRWNNVSVFEWLINASSME